MKDYVALIKYNQLGQAKNVRMPVVAANMEFAVNQVTPSPGAVFVTYHVDDHTAVTVRADDILSIQTCELAGE